MVIFYLTITLIFIAIGLAVTPLLWAMKRQVESEARISVPGGVQGSLLQRDAVMRQVANVADPRTDITGIAA